MPDSLPYYCARVVAAIPPDADVPSAHQSFATYEEAFATADDAQRWAIKTADVCTAVGSAVYACTIIFDARGYVLAPRSLRDIT